MNATWETGPEDQVPRQERKGWAKVFERVNSSVIFEGEPGENQ